MKILVDNKGNIVRPYYLTIDFSSEIQYQLIGNSFSSLILDYTEE